MANRIYKEDPFHFAPLWDAILDIYEEFARICKENNLRHYVIGGTLLGAVRHGGFIPWDDDFDLAMPRPDYDKFRKIMANTKSENIRFLDYHIHSNFNYLFGKVMARSKDKVEDIEKAIGRNLPEGLFVDIFPLDGYPENRIGVLFCKVYEIGFKVIYAAYLRIGDGKYQWVKRTLRRCLKFVNFITGISKIHDVIPLNDRYLQRYKYDTNRKSGMGGFLLGRFQMIFPARIWEDTITVSFCGIDVPAPSEWDAYLKISYGEYMELPPVDKRIPSHANEKMAEWRFE